VESRILKEVFLHVRLGVTRTTTAPLFERSDEHFVESSHWRNDWKCPDGIKDKMVSNRK
jgi:hypothetical protein